LLSQRNRLHDLPGLAISALRRIHLNPRFLDGMQSVPPTSSIVRILLPAAALSGVIHDRIASPLLCTVQAPQSAIRNQILFL